MWTERRGESRVVREALRRADTEAWMEEGCLEEVCTTVRTEGAHTEG